MDVSFSRHSRVSLQLPEEDRVLVCCLESPSAAIRRSHEAVQTCFHDLCQAAIRSICQVCGAIGVGGGG